MSESQGIRPGVHLVGSVPLESSAAVFRAAAGALGPYLRRIPDGETGERTGWVAFQVPMFTAHPSFEVAPSDPAGTASQRPAFRLREGVDPATLAFGDLGYSTAALASYQGFADLKADGVIPTDTRFQVSLPTPLAPLAIFVAAADIPAVLPAYQAAMMGELAKICAAVPPGELAIQWDVAMEVALLEGVWPAPFDHVDAVITHGLVGLGDAVPPDVEVGYHFCYGDFGHQHFVEPTDLAVLVKLANTVADGLARKLNWIHVPVPRDRDDDAYFAPMSGLRLATGTELYLGLVHATDGVEGARLRIRAAANVYPDFGIGTECGFGRRDPATVPALLELHRELAADRD
jgi:hypothetical protein